MKMLEKLFDDFNLEIQSHCNRSCFFCPRTYDRSGKYFDDRGKSVVKEMPTGKILDILDQLHDMGYNGRVSNHHLSEPLLDKRAISIAREIKKRGMMPVMNTNGDPIRRNDELNRQVAEVFEYVVVGIYDLNTPEEIQEEKDFWIERLKGTEVFFSVNLPAESGNSSVDGPFPRTNVPYDKRMRTEKHTYPDGACHRPLERMLIEYDGNVALCCEDHNAEFGLGNAFETPIKDIWYSEKRLKIVGDLMEGCRTLYPLCSICSMPPTKAPRGWRGDTAYRDRY